MILFFRMYRTSLLFATYLLPFLSFETALRIWSTAMAISGRPVSYAHQWHFSMVLVSTLIWAVVAKHYGVTSMDELFRERTGAKAAWSACSVTAMILLAFLYFSRSLEFPRGLFTLAMVILLGLTIVMRAGFRAFHKRERQWGRRIKILIIGADQYAQEAATRLQRLSFAPCEIAAYVRLPGQERCVGQSPVYELTELGTLSANHGIDEAVMALHPMQFAQIPAIMKSLEKLCLPARAIVDLGEGIVMREALFQLGRMQMLDLTMTPADSIDYVVMKRAFDICFSAVILLLTAPLLLAIALIIRLTSQGPVYFMQERVGLNGSPFLMYKFRTMRVPTTDKNQGNTRWTVQNDPRTTPVGALLRKLSLDELPQFMNVLKGDMSVVGPRPERPYFVHKFLDEIAHYNTRHCLKVGITGWAQVNGWRGDTSIERRIEHDLYYLQNWSFWLDLRIIGMTFFCTLIGKNAY
jgi:Undecaprenyl-phosphate glucose phosphotransferase